MEGSLWRREDTGHYTKRPLKRRRAELEVALLAYGGGRDTNVRGRWVRRSQAAGRKGSSALHAHTPRERRLSVASRSLSAPERCRMGPLCRPLVSAIRRRTDYVN